MANSLKDINAVLNVGGVLSYANGVASSGGELVAYDKTPIGGPPATDFDEDVRAPDVLTLTVRVVGADVAAMEAVIEGFKRGKVFSCKASASGATDMKITGFSATGRDFTVTNCTINYQFQQNAELSVVLTESGATPAG